MSSKEIKLRKIIPKGERALMLPVVSSDILALTFWRLSATGFTACLVRNHNAERDYQ